jgi:hypothetical protein
MSLEAQASRTQVIAFGKGRSLRTVIPRARPEMAATGIFSEEQTGET